MTMHIKCIVFRLSAVNNADDGAAFVQYARTRPIDLSLTHCRLTDPLHWG